MELIAAAKKYSESGISVIPTKANKQPAIIWKPYQLKPMKNGEIEKSFVINHVVGIAAICGKVSNNLEVIDIDCKYDITGNLWKDFQTLIEDNLPELYGKLVIAKTTNNGYHIYYRCEKVEGNKKLATRPTLPDEKKKNQYDTNRVLIETRGTGGYVIAAPTPGYEFIQGNPDVIPLITPEQREILFAIAQSFNEVEQDNQSTGTSTFDDYNQKADVIDLLKKHQWKVWKENGNLIQLTRPGKQKDVSATYFKNKKILYVFSTSTSFEANKGYNPTQVYTILECSGNYSEAAKKLYADEYGDRFEPVITTTSEPEPEPVTPLLPIDGMPEFIQRFINTMHEIYTTPRDYWAGAAIMATALAIGDKMELKTKYKNNPILWGMFVGDVSNGKTEPLDLCLKYFQKVDADSIKKFELDLNEYERASRLTKQERIDEGSDEKPEKPQCFQYILVDSTPEAMAEAHRINNRGLIINRDELKGWIDDFGRYAKSGEQSNMLSMWSQKSVTYNRKSTGILNVQKPCVLVAGGIHRELLHTLATENRAENGFLARMIAFFPDNTEKQQYNNAMPDLNLLEDWENYLKELTEIKEPKLLTLSEKSANLYETWYNENVIKINSEPTAYLKGIYGKLDIILLRIAIVIRAMNYAREGITTPEITAREMEAAIQITEYFRATALKVYRQIFGETKYGKLEKEDIAVWLSKNTNLTKKQIAEEVLRSSRSQLDRLITQKP